MIEYPIKPYSFYFLTFVAKILTKNQTLFQVKRIPLPLLANEGKREVPGVKPEESCNFLPDSSHDFESYDE
jgi:hypothetical protein